MGSARKVDDIDKILTSKLKELKQFEQLFSRQIESLQKFFDKIDDEQNFKKSRNGSATKFFLSRQEPNYHSNGTALRGEGATFKATMHCILASLEHCINVMEMAQHEYNRNLQQNVDKYKQLEIENQVLKANIEKLQLECNLAPEPKLKSPTNEKRVTIVEKDDDDDQFFDAVDFEPEGVRTSENAPKAGKVTSLMRKSATEHKFSRILISSNHDLFKEIDNMTREQLRYALVGSGSGVWEKFHQEGEMRIYKREVDVEGVTVDPLKAVHHVKGVSAHEFLHYFFEPPYKMGWDDTIEQVNVIEKISEDCMIFQQIHKRIFPTAQRESLFWSHMRMINDEEAAQHQDGQKYKDLMLVCNHDTLREDVPLKSGRCRVGLTVAMVCRTIVNDDAIDKPESELTRDDISCSVIYVSSVHPGGWAPRAGLLMVYKREYPKFLRKFTKYVLEHTQGKPIMF